MPEPRRRGELDNGESVVAAALEACFTAWMHDAGLFVAVLIPVGVFLYFWDLVAANSPYVGAGYTTEELTILWLVPIATLVCFGTWRIYRLVVHGQSVGMRRAAELKSAERGRGGTRN